MPWEVVQSPVFQAVYISLHHQITQGVLMQRWGRKQDGIIESLPGRENIWWQDQVLFLTSRIVPKICAIYSL